MYVIIDRIENEFIWVEMENRELVKIPKVLVPNGAEGDVVYIGIDLNETSLRKKRIHQLMDQAFESFLD